MTVNFSLDEITIAPDRQRQDKPVKYIDELAADIEENSLYHAPVVSMEDGAPFPTLVAGECRLTAIRQLLEAGRTFEYNGEVYSDAVPCNVLTPGRTEYQLKRIELHENIVRRSLSWQEHTRAVAELHRLEKAENPEHTIRKTGRMVLGLPVEDESDADSQVGEQVAQQAVKLDKFLDDPDVAAAPNPRKALKIAETKARAKEYAEQRQLREQAGEEVTLTSRHRFEQGDSVQLLAEEPNEKYDCILTDPPYGLDISNTHWARGSSAYTDDEEHAAHMYRTLFAEGYRITKDGGFLFAFCDPRMFAGLVAEARDKGWDVWPHPIIWDRSPKGLLPIPSFGPRRCYEMILMARKGEGTVVREGRGDVIRIPLDPEHNRPGEKPVALYEELLSRVCYAGSKVLDPFAGTGPIIPAAHELMCEATAFDQDTYASDVCAALLEKYI